MADLETIGDVELTCQSCRTVFTFTKEQRVDFAALGWHNPPRTCKPCAERNKVLKQFIPKYLACRRCQTRFAFSRQEQKEAQDRDIDEDPAFCPECRLLENPQEMPLPALVTEPTRQPQLVSSFGFRPSFGYSSSSGNPARTDPDYDRKRQKSATGKMGKRRKSRR